MKLLDDLMTFNGTVSRKRYLLVGVALFALKLLIDESVSMLLFHRVWSLSNYYRLGTVLWVMGGGTTGNFYDDFNWFPVLYFLTMVACAFPFIWVGLAYSIRRLRDAHLPLPLVVLFMFRPFNWILIALLSVLPTNAVSPEVNYQPISFERVLSRNDKTRKTQCIVVTACFVVLVVIWGIYKLKTYGTMLFVGVPVLMGYSVGWFDSYYDVNFNRSWKVAMNTLTAVGLALLVIAIEGIVCLAMAFPIAVGMVTLGVWMGVATAKSSTFGKNAYILCSPIASLPFLMFLESILVAPAPLLHVRSEVVVNAPIKTVWVHMISFPRMQAPKELLFKAGIAYPMDATITGTGLGAVRQCSFSTGTVVESVTRWEAPTLLQFSVLKEPEPMKEMSLYKINPPHLHGYLKSEIGQFRLIPLSPNRTELVASSWYRDNIWPQCYWSIWSNAIFHQIHLRVLNDIKSVSEADVISHSGINP